MGHPSIHISIRKPYTADSRLAMIINFVSFYKKKRKQNSWKTKVSEYIKKFIFTQVIAEKKRTTSENIEENKMKIKKKRKTTNNIFIMDFSLSENSHAHFTKFLSNQNNKRGQTLVFVVYD